MKNFGGLAVFVKAEYGHCRFGIDIVVMYGAVVHSRVAAVQHLDDFLTGPSNRPVSVSRFHAHRPVIVVGGIKSHAGAHAHSLYFALVVDF